jgi:hypothetical protein
VSKTDRSFWLQWVLANTLAEIVGLGGAFVIGYGLVLLLDLPAGAGPTLRLAGLAIVLGTAEGLIVGLAQGLVLKQRLPQLGLNRWVPATAAGAFLAWVLGMLPSTAMDLGQQGAAAPPPDIPDIVNYLMAIVLGAVAGPILASVQWLVLRRHIARAWRWIPANALAWMVGMPVIFIGPGVISVEMSPLVIGLVVLVTVGLAGAAVGAIHGYVLVRFLLPAGKQ